jgi:hypothetical protein
MTTQFRIKFILILCGFYGLTWNQTIPILMQAQQHSQWCWAATSYAIVNHYAEKVRQCDIANFSRIKINSFPVPFHDFGKTDCCADTTTFNMSETDGSCNYWNFNWGFWGSIEEIFAHWGIENHNISGPLSLKEIERQIKNQKAFILLFVWKHGGGHFLLGRGIDMRTQNIHIINPWPGHGHEIIKYSQAIRSQHHNWTHTNTMLKPVFK